MFFRESAIIVSNQHFIEEDVVAVDGYLHANQGEPVRVGRLSDFTGVKESVAESILASFLAAGVVNECSIAVCTKCDELVEADQSTGKLECDLCESALNPEKTPFETVYIPRKTEFECGDVLPIASGGRPEVDGVERIVGCSDEDRIADIVFVHGLDGDAMSTWHPQDAPAKFWPKWLGIEFPSVGVWSLGYKASSIGWKGSSMPLSDRAINVLAMLEAAGIGERPVIFVVHSLGGLLVKQLLRHGRDFGNKNWATITSNTKGIVFIATPHSGSDLANYIKHLGSLLQATVTVDELKAHAPSLRDLSLWFRNNCQSMAIDVEVLYEKEPTHGVIVVDPTSSDPGIVGVIPIPIDADHISICKPDSKAHPVFARVRLFVNKWVSRLNNN